MKKTICTLFVALSLGFMGFQVNAQENVTANGGTFSAQFPDSKPAEGVAKLFDNNTGTKFYFPGKNAIWIRYNSSIPVTIKEYSLASANDSPGRDPKNWTLEASNDSIGNWTVIDTRNDEYFSDRGQINNYKVSKSDVKYRFFRLNISATLERDFQLAEWTLWASKKR